MEQGKYTSCAGSTGRFYRLAGGEALPKPLRQSAPEILWIPSDALRCPTPSRNARELLRGCALDESEVAATPLITLEDGAAPRVHFDVARTIDGILLEEYHRGLESTLEMRLPFNYSLLPPWVKACGRFLRKGSLSRRPEVAFPSRDPCLPVDWLHGLAQWSGAPPSNRSLPIQWPNGHRAALTISHDVDTDWLFRHPDWIERICGVEERHGLFGAWYCVPAYSQSKRSEEGIARLVERGCEIGCHGYNHDAKWPLLRGAKFDNRVKAVQEFRDRWQARGFRSEWLWRTPAFLSAIAELFDYDSSVPAVSSRFTRQTRNGCGTCFPYVTHGDLVELPLTLPMDEERHGSGLDLGAFWRSQVSQAQRIIEGGGFVMLSLHPQPHQAANTRTLACLSVALEEIVSAGGLWIARPDRIADWVRTCIRPDPTHRSHERV